MSDSFCALCQSPIGSSEETSCCPECGAIYHEECHAENGGCGTYGCPRVPPPSTQAVAVAPPSVWGRETKPCPGCGKEIRAAAIRCRHCGTIFGSAEAMTGEELGEARARQARLRTLRRNAVAAFVGGVVPCTAPIILIGGSLFFFVNRSFFRKLPPAHRVLVVLGLSVSGLWVVLGAAVMLFSKGSRP